MHSEWPPRSPSQKLNDLYSQRVKTKKGPILQKYFSPHNNNIGESEFSIANLMIIIFNRFILSKGIILKFTRKSLTQSSPNHCLFSNYVFEANELS